VKRIKDALHLGVEDWSEDIKHSFLLLKIKDIFWLERAVLSCVQFLRLIAFSNIKHFFSSDKMKNNRLKSKHQIIEVYVIVWVGILFSLITHISYSHLKIIVIIVVFWLLFVAYIVIKTMRDDKVFKRFCWCFIFCVIVLWGLLILGIVWLLPGLVILFIAFYRLLEILSTQFGNIFVDREINSLNRSLLLIGINYLEIMVIFAIMFLATHSLKYSTCNNIVTTWRDALYFSALTITSFGCENMQPLAPWGTKLAAFELIVGLLVIVVVIGAFFTFYGKEKLHN
jgi:hypothetical protein